MTKSSHSWLVILLCILACMIIIVFIKITCSQNIVNLQNINSNIPSVDGGIIDKEHLEIDAAFEHLLKTVKKHWNTEDEVFEKGLKNLPPSHKYVNAAIQEHKQVHRDSVEKIEKLREAIHAHITEYDVPHFHWLVP